MADIVEYAKANNFLKVMTETGFGLHDVKVILVLKGRLLDARNEWTDLSHTELHEEAQAGFVMPTCFDNLLDVCQEAAVEPGSCTLARVTAAIKECLREGTGIFLLKRLLPFILCNLPSICYALDSLQLALFDL